VALAVAAVAGALLLAGPAAAETSPQEDDHETLGQLVTPTGDHGGTTLYVCKQGPPVCNTDSIQDAVNFAADGDTIEVWPGEYEEKVVVDTEVTIESRDGLEDTTITYTDDSGTPTVSVEHHNVTVQGFTIERGDSSSNIAQGLRIAASDAEVEELRVEKLGDRDQDQGIAVLDGTPTASAEVQDVRLTGVNVTGFTNGVGVATQHADGSVADVEVQDLVVRDTRFGVGLATTRAADTSPQDVDVAEATIAGNDNGVYVFGATDGDLFNDAADGSQIEIAGSTFEENRIHVLDRSGEHPLRQTFETNEFDLAALVVDGDEAASTAITSAIQASVDLAEAGQTVLVDEGVYEEAVTVDVPNLELAPLGDVTIRHAPGTAEGTPTVNLVADGVTVSDVEIVRVAADDRQPDSAHAQGLAVRASDVTVAGTTLVGENLSTDTAYERFDGLMVVDNDDARAVRLENNTVEGFHAGIVVTSAFEDTAVEGVQLVDNEATENEHGFVAKYHEGFPGTQPRAITGAENAFVDNRGANIVLANGTTFQGYDVGAFDPAQIGFDGPIPVQDGDSLQTAEHVAAAGATIEVEADAAFQELLRVRTCGLTIAADGDGAELHADSATAGKNHRPTLQLAADGATVDNLEISRVVDDPKAAGSGHTKAVGVNFDRSTGYDAATDGCTDGVSAAEGVTLRNLDVTLRDATGEEDLGNAVWVSTFNAAGGERAPLGAALEEVTVENDGVPAVDGDGPLDGFGGSAVAVCAREQPVSASLDGSQLRGEDRGLYAASCPNPAPLSLTVNATDVTGAGGAGVLLEADGTSLTASAGSVADNGAGIVVEGDDASLDLGAELSVATNDGAGIATLGEAPSVDARNILLESNADAGLFNDGSQPDVTVRHSRILDNGVGINNTASEPIDAAENWWGTPTGPEDVGGSFEVCTGVVPCFDTQEQLFLTDGENVRGAVEYFPWCRTPDCTLYS
jgi:nitrous oxidase accessory protein NosD